MSPIPILYLSLLPLFIVLFVNRNRKKRTNKAIGKRLTQNREDLEKMLEVSKELIGKDVYIKTITEELYMGILKEIKGNALVVEEKNIIENINIDYILSIKEYPHKPNGKRKNIW